MKITSKATSVLALCSLLIGSAVVDGRAALIPAPDDQEEPAVVSETNGFLISGELSNEAPSISIQFPTNGAVFAASANIMVLASVHDPDGAAALARVEFFANGQSIGAGQLTDPGPLHDAAYRFFWTNVAAGEYALTGRVTDERGGSSTSIPVAITVRSSNTNPPSVSVVATIPDALEGPIFLLPSATGDAGLITNNAPIALNIGRFTITREGNTDEPLAVYYSLSGTASNGVDYIRLSGVLGIPAGARSAGLAVVPLDDPLVEGDETVVLALEPNAAYRIGSPAAATVVIHDSDPQTNRPPTVGIFWPTNGSVFIAPPRIFVEVSVEDPDGPAASAVVEILANGNSLGLAQLTDPGPLHEAHFRFVWTNPLPGEYALTARATDAAGATAISTPVRVIIRSLVPPGLGPRLPMEPMSYASFVISANGILNAWGDNTWGELGYGWPSGASYTPLRVPLPVGVAGWKVVASSGHTLAITTDDQLYAWGANSQGQLGVGHTNQLPNPTLVSLPDGVSGWIATAAGGSHSVAISKEGQLYVWGGGKFPLRLQPTLVPPPDGVTRWVAVTAGQNHSLALTDTGEIYGWGDNELGQLGNGQTGISFSPLLTLTIRPAGVARWKQVVAGAAHTLVLADNNQLYACGGNFTGQLGTGVAGNASNLVPVSVPAGVTGWSAIAAGQAHSLGIANDGRLFAWGANDHTQLGTGNTNLQSASTPIFVPPPAGVTGWQAVAAGYWHSVAVGLDCQVYAWGWNAIGQAGYPNGGYFVPVPHLVDGLGDLCNPVLNVLPTVTIIFPTNGASFTALANVRLHALVTDADGPAGAAFVEFFTETERIGVGTYTEPQPGHEAHFYFTWEDVPAGTYRIVAKATDIVGASNFSAPVHITVLESSTNGIPVVTIRASDPEASEQNSDPAVFVVSRSPVSDRPLTVYYRVGGSASNGVDYVALSSPVVIAAGAASAEIVVRPVDDTLVEGTEVVLVGLTLPPIAPAVYPPLPPPYYLGEPSNAQAFIRDNDPPCVNGSNDCTIAQLCPCDNSWRSQAEYVRCVIQQAWRFFRAGLITADQRRSIIRDAILSNCGKHPAEPVCIHVLPLTPEECRRDGDQFVLSGDSSGACIIETSTDLVHWTPVQMDAIFIDGREVVCADPNPVPARFYRVRLDPVP
jgi:alpha-tubulin suppressor-like RCC1 family protein